MARWVKTSSLLTFGWVGSLWLAAPAAFASHPTVELRQAALVAGAGHASTETVRVISVVGDPVGGMATNGSLTVQSGYQASLPTWPTGSRAITVEGVVNDDTETRVAVNGVAAARVGDDFHATGVRLLEGPTLLTVTATDQVGNRSQRQLTVWLATRPPARPTVTRIPAVTTDSRLTLTGTKTAGTSLWVNGREVLPFNRDTTWEASIELREGDNVLSLATKDAVDNASTQATRVIVLDQLPPVLSVSAPELTNLTPALVRGTVDDSLTRLTAHGLAVTQTGSSFAVDVPLIEGANALTLVATSPTGLVTTRPLIITLGTIPTLTAMEPADGSFVIVGEPVPISASATDREGHPVEYQLWRDGVLLVDWTATATSAWTPTEDQLGVHALEARARDGFGGEAAQQVEVFVVRQPVSPP